MWSAARSAKISMILCMPERVSGGDAKFQGFCDRWNKWEGQPAIQASQAASRRHSAKAAARVCLKISLAVEMAFVAEVVMDRGTDGGEFLQGLYVPEIGHCRFPSSERLVRVLGPVVEPPTTGPGGRIADHSHRSSVERKPVRDDRSRPAITLHRAFQKPECSPAIPPFRCKNLKHFPFVVNRTP